MPLSRRLSSSSVRTAPGSPTCPRLTSVPSSSTCILRFAVTILSSLPESPTARPPASVIELAICLLMLPHSTISAASIVALSVTRSPATNSLLISSFFSMALICGPPPWTTTTRTPSDCMSAQSAANDFESSGSVMACPPYLTTTTSPAQEATRPSWLGSVASLAPPSATTLQRRWASGNRAVWVHRSAALHAANSATRVILILLMRGKGGRSGGRRRGLSASKKGRKFEGDNHGI